MLAFNGEDRVAVLGRWQGTDFNYEAPQTSFASADGKTFTVNRSDLGRTRGFWFAVVAGLHSDAKAVDIAPTDVAWKYELDGLAQVSTGDASFNGPPRANGVFAVTRVELGLSDGSTVRPTAFSCVAKLAGKTLKPAGRCAWRLPSSAKGKRLVVTISVAYDGVSGRLEAYRFRVR